MLGLTIIFTLTSYFFNYPVKVIKLLIPVISMFISSLLLGRSVQEKAYLEGLKFGGIYLLLVIIFALITKVSFNIKLIISYLLILLTSVIGAMIGINIRKKD